MTDLIDRAYLDALLAPLPLETRAQILAAGSRDLKTFSTMIRDMDEGDERARARHQLKGAAGGIGASALLAALDSGACGADLADLADATIGSLPSV